jgi:hypothetical protein
MANLINGLPDLMTGRPGSGFGTPTDRGDDFSVEIDITSAFGRISNFVREVI